MSKALYEPALRYLAGNYDGSFSEGNVRVSIRNRPIGPTILSEALKEAILHDPKDKENLAILIRGISEQKDVLPRRMNCLLDLDCKPDSVLGSAIFYLKGVKNGHLNTDDGEIEVQDLTFSTCVDSIESILRKLAKDGSLKNEIFIPAYRERLIEFADAIENSESINQEDLMNWFASVRGPIKQELNIYL